MELRECYTSFGGDFDEVLGRLRREQLVEKFVFKFLPFLMEAMQTVYPG